MRRFLACLFCKCQFLLLIVFWLLAKEVDFDSYMVGWKSANFQKVGLLLNPVYHSDTSDQIAKLPISLGIQSPSENGSMEPKDYAFRRWLDTPIIWEYDWISMVYSEMRLEGQTRNTKGQGIIRWQYMYHMFLLAMDMLPWTSFHCGKIESSQQKWTCLWKWDWSLILKKI